MTLRQRLKNFLFLVLKSLHPRYFTSLSEYRVSKAIQYFLVLLFFSFIMMGVLAAPKALIIKSDLDQALLDIAELRITAEFETANPVSIPRNNPLITLDTTNGKKVGDEIIFLTDEKLTYDFNWKSGEFDLNEYDFTNDREGSKKLVILLYTMLLPSILVFYYFAYVIKYILIIYPVALITFSFARAFKSIITLKQTLTLAFFTSTAMIIIEILTIPFSELKRFLVVSSPLIGVNYSLVALTIYLIFFVTAVRISGNPGLQD